MKKKCVIIISIVCWLIGLIVIFCLVGIRVHYMEEETPKVFDASFVSESERLHQVANGTIKKGDPLFESALLGRISLSDSMVKGNDVSREQVTILASKNGEHALSRGIWHEIVKEDENGEIALVDGLIGVVDIVLFLDYSGATTFFAEGTGPFAWEMKQAYKHFEDSAQTWL